MRTYNGAKFIRDRMNSIFNQTLPPDELIICDDNSLDNTIEILYELSEKAPFPVKIFRNEIKLGFIKNFERAVKLTRGGIILFSDQDDIFYPEKIEILYKKLTSDKDATLIFSNADLVNEYGTRLNKKLWEAEGFDRIEQKNF